MHSRAIENSVADIEPWIKHAQNFQSEGPTNVL